MWMELYGYAGCGSNFFKYGPNSPITREQVVQIKDQNLTSLASDLAVILTRYTKKFKRIELSELNKY